MDDLDRTATPLLVQRARAHARREPLLKSDDYWRHVRALHVRSGRDVFDEAVMLCVDSDPVSRSVGANILAQLGARKGVATIDYPFADESTPVLVGLLADTEAQVIASALSALGHLGRGEPAHLTRLAGHQSTAVRWALAYALGGRDDPISVDCLIALSADSDCDTRDWATFALGALSEGDSPAIRDALAARLSDVDEIRGEAMAGLARRLDERAVEPILRELGKTSVMASRSTLPRRCLDRSSFDRSTRYVQHTLKTKPLSRRCVVVVRRPGIVDSPGRCRGPGERTRQRAAHPVGSARRPSLFHRAPDDLF